MLITWKRSPMPSAIGNKNQQLLKDALRENAGYFLLSRSNAWIAFL
jgi:hypothetical protein